MRRSPKLRPTLWDGLVVLLTLALAIGSAFFIWGGEQETGDVTVVISVDGEEVERLPLAKYPGWRWRVFLQRLHPEGGDELPHLS